MVSRVRCLIILAMENLKLLCFRRFLCVHVNVLPIDTLKGNKRPRLLRDTHQGLLHIPFARELPQ